MDIALQARVVFPVDQPPIEHGVVIIHGDRILRVGKNVAEQKPVDLGDVALLPGFVNAHTHLEFSYLRQPLGEPGIPLVDWIRLVIAERGRGRSSTADDLRDGIAESHHSGVLTIADISTSAHRLPADVTYFHEVIGFSRARAASALNAVDERLAHLRELNQHFRSGISPHAPYTVSPQLLRDLVARANDFHLPMAMHIAESQEELELLRHGKGAFRDLLEERSMWDAEAIPRGSRPLDYLQVLSESPRALVIHGNYLDRDELDFLAARSVQMSLVYCPRTHAYFCHAPYPLEQALAAGVHLALGTDSRASNPDLSMLDEMRHVSRSHPIVEPQQILRMATLCGAEALGRDSDVGSITPGKLANLVAVSLEDSSKGQPSDWLASIFSAKSPPSAVWCRGTPVESSAD
jgi:cytosine/adenosine deaminase-related metal-dependent hydrolase